MSRLRNLFAIVVGLAALTTTSLASTTSAPADPLDTQENVQTDGLPAAFKTLTPDWNPATGRVQGEFNPDHGAVALDYLRRSTVADLSGMATVRRIELVDRDATTRLKASDYTLWASDDNQSYQEVTGWSFEAEVVDGRMKHTFSGFEIDARYVKINTSYDDHRFTSALDDPAEDFRLYGDPPDPNPDPGAALEVVDSWEVTTAASFPDVENPEEMHARVPGLLRAPNGDILLTFNTATDANPGGELRLMRSTDDGKTWGPSEVIATPSQYPDGSIASAGEWTTLSDGTILLSYTEAVNHSRFNNREGVKFVARSTDNGHTWQGTDEPIEFPVPFREQFTAHGSLVETADGTLLLPFWGAQELSEDWETNPQPKTSAILRSFDGGETWPDYRVVAYDPNVPPIFPPFGSAPNAGGPSEFDIKQIPSGRLVAMIRTNNAVDPMRFQSLRSYSDDNGATWSTPQPTGYVAPAASLEFAPCTDYLPEGQTKLLLGHRGITTRGKTLVGVSFDEGVMWHDEFALEDPLGREFYGLLGGEPDFLQLDDQRMLVVFQASDADNPDNPPGQVTPPWQIMANVIEDAAPEDCLAEAEAAQERLEDEPTVFVERDDRDQWTRALAAKNAVQPAATTVDEFAETQAPALSCRADQPLAIRDEDGTVLNPSDTLIEAGVRNGDSVVLTNPDPMARPFRVGTAELDVSPPTRPVANWDDACAPTQLPLDYRGRSLGLDLVLPAGRSMSAIELRSNSDTTRLTESDYRLWSSTDNVHYTEITNWSFNERVEDGRVVHRFDDLAVTDRYLKISHTYTNAAFTFILDNPREDISLEYSARACDTTITGSVIKPLTIDDPGTTCVDGATIAGPVTVEAGSSVTVRHSQISGPLTTDSAAAVSICESTINGRVAISDNTGPVLIGQSDTHDCGPNTITGPLSLDDNTSAIWASHNRVTGPMTVTGNTFRSSAFIADNRVAGPLRCSDNTPEIDGGDNVVIGPKTGQCADL